MNNSGKWCVKLFKSYNSFWANKNCPAWFYQIYRSWRMIFEKELWEQQFVVNSSWTTRKAGINNSHSPQIKFRFISLPFKLQFLSFHCRLRLTQNFVVNICIIRLLLVNINARPIFTRAINQRPYFLAKSRRYSVDCTQ